MNIRHLATKSFSGGIETRKSIVYDGVPIVINGSLVRSEEVVEFTNPEENNVEIVESIGVAKDMIKSSPIGQIVSDGDSILSLSSIYDFAVEQNSPLASDLPVGISFNDIFEDKQTKEFMSGVASTMFPYENPNTGKKDIDTSAFYAPYVPLVVLSGCVPAQHVDVQTFFNPEGIVTVAEFLDGINSIKYGSNSNKTRKKTLDNISDESDYFNEGYQSCLSDISSPFFNLYTRKELTQAITRVELAYILVVCWDQFIHKYTSLYGNQFYLGINFDWNAPADILSGYVDGFDYKVSKVSIDKGLTVTSLNIKDYKSDRTMEEYKTDLKDGVSPIPLPMLMSLSELGVADLFYFQDKRLDPLREVSRGEFSYFLTKLAKLFPTKYTNK